MSGMEPTTRRRRGIRLALILVPALAFVALLVAAVLREGGSLQAGDPAPAFSAPRLDGSGTLSSGDLTGKPYVLNFWASWCAPCKDEAPMLSRAATRYEDEIAFVGVDIRDARTEALRFIEEHGLDYEHVRDDSLAIYDDFGLTGQPETFFVDGRGVIVRHVAGPLTEEDLQTTLDILVSRGG